MNAKPEPDSSNHTRKRRKNGNTMLNGIILLRRKEYIFLQYNLFEPSKMVPTVYLCAAITIKKRTSELPSLPNTYPRTDRSS